MLYGPGEDGAALHRGRLAAAGRFLASGRHDEAAALIEAARAAEPDDPDGLNAWGVLCLARGETGRALSILGAAATACPDHPGLIANLGAAHHAAGNLDDAEICLRRALALAPRNEAALRSLAEVGLSRGDLAGAEEAARRLLALNPSAPEPAGILGFVALAREDRPQAIGHLRDALIRGSQDPDILRVLSLLLLAEGEAKEALALAERARLPAPLDRDTLAHLARCQAEGGLWAEAEATCRSVLAFAPDHLELRALHARTRMALGQTEAALADLSRFTRAHPNSTPALFALAAAARQAGRLAEALPLAREVLRREPSHGAARRLEEEIVLAQGQGLPPLDPPPPDEARLVVPPDLPATDLIALARLLPVRAGEGGAVRLSAPVHALPLLAHLPVVLDAAAAQPGEATLALPDCLRGAGPGGDGVPYLRPDPALAARWLGALQDHPRPWIGVVWDDITPGLTMDLIRAALPGGASAVSLTTGASRHALADWPEAIDAGAHCDGFAAMIAAIAALDGVIGPDQAALHLAGALGRPGAVAAEVRQPWYWASRGDRALWYPTVRVARQARIGDWDDVIGTLRIWVSEFGSG